MPTVIEIEIPTEDEMRDEVYAIISSYMQREGFDESPLTLGDLIDEVDMVLQCELDCRCGMIECEGSRMVALLVFQQFLYGEISDELHEPYIELWHPLISAAPRFNDDHTCQPGCRCDQAGPTWGDGINSRIETPFQAFLGRQRGSGVVRWVLDERQAASHDELPRCVECGAWQPEHHEGCETTEHLLFDSRREVSK